MVRSCGVPLLPKLPSSQQPSPALFPFPLFMRDYTIDEGIFGVNFEHLLPCRSLPEPFSLTLVHNRDNSLHAADWCMYPLFGAF